MCSISCDNRFYSHLADCSYERYSYRIFQGAMEAQPCSDQSKQVSMFLISLSSSIFLEVLLFTAFILCVFESGQSDFRGPILRC